jgi:putative transposase
MTVSNELIDRLLANYKKPEDIIGENGLLKQVTKRLVERTLEAAPVGRIGVRAGCGIATRPHKAQHPMVGCRLPPKPDRQSAT